MYKDIEGGGIADRPGDEVDVFHTIFGIAGVFSSSLTLFLMFTAVTQVFLSWVIQDLVTLTLCTACRQS